MSITFKSVEKMAGPERYLHPLDFVLATGSLTVLLGPIRAGKTTMMRLMAGLDQPSAGKIIENENDVTGLDVRKRNVAMVYQQFINYPNSTVFENIAPPIRVAGKMSRSEREARVRDLAARLAAGFFKLPAPACGARRPATAHIYARAPRRAWRA